MDEDGVARLERLPRTRVSQLVADYLAHGWHADDICREYPHLRPAEVHSAFAYYFDNVDAIEAEIESELKECEARTSKDDSPLRLRLKKLRTT